MYAAATLKRIPRLASTCSLLHGLDPQGVLNLDMFTEARDAYEELRRERDAVGAEYDVMDEHEYTTVRGGRLEGHYHPKNLPKVLPPLSALYDTKSKIKIPSAKALNAVVLHRRWLDCLKAAKLSDQTDKPVIKNREASRRLAVSQTGAGAPFEISPDGSFPTTIPSVEMEIILQRHGGLNLACAKGLYDAEEAAGKAVDRRGDDLSNGGEYNRRHHAVLRKGYQMISAVSVGSVVLGDKEDLEKTNMLNTGYAVDIAELEGDDATGGDALYEVKVPSPLTKSQVKGCGGRDGSGQPASVGHLFAFGNTEERYRLKILGCRRRGRKRDGPLNHHTGKGYVAEVRGDYYDALFVKRSRVIPFIVEATGGITPHALAHVTYLARRARGKTARDSTRYGTSRTSTRNFYVHHTQRIGLAAKQYDAKAIRKSLCGRKQKLIGRAAGGAP